MLLEDEGWKRECAVKDKHMTAGSRIKDIEGQATATNWMMNT